jgi:predicted transcriptional regulator
MAESAPDEEDDQNALRKEVVQLLKREPPLTPKQIAETLERNRNTIRTVVAQLLAKGRLIRTEKGEYATPDQNL